jgi:hypothetical protein
MRFVAVHQNVAITALIPRSDAKPCVSKDDQVGSDVGARWRVPSTSSGQALRDASPMASLLRMRASGRSWVSVVASLVATIALFAPAAAEAADTIRLAVQKTGTVAWEIAAMKALGLDKAADLDIQTTELATTDSGKIALHGPRARNASIS